MANLAALEALKKKHGFNTPDVEIHRRLIATVSALQKRGKSHFAMTAPYPMVYYNIDNSLEGVISKFAKHKNEFLEYKLPLPDASGKDVMEEAQEIWNKFEESFTATLNCSDVRTVVIDTATELWELVRLADLGSLTKVQGKQYAYTPLNAKFRRFLRQIQDKPDKNLILLHKMKPLWLDNNRTGRFERAGFGDVDFIAQVVVELDRIDPNVDNPETVFKLKIMDSRHNPALNGFELEGEMVSFPMLASMVIEGTTLEDWGWEG